MFLRVEPSMVQRLLISYRYRLPRASSFSATSFVSRGPLYSAMKARFLISSVANRPRPVRERPTRKGFLRGIGAIYGRFGWRVKMCILGGRRGCANHLARAIQKVVYWYGGEASHLARVDTGRPTRHAAAGSPEYRPSALRGPTGRHGSFCQTPCGI